MKLVSGLSSRLIKISRLIDRFNEVIAKISAHGTMVMVVLTFIISVLRYVFNIGFVALQESVIYFHSAVFLLSAAYALRHGYHVRIDLLYCRQSPRGKAKIEIFGILFFLFPVAFLCLLISWEYVAISWKYLEGSGTANGLDLIFLLKTLLLIMPSLLILQGISDLIRNIFLIQGKIED